MSRSVSKLLGLWFGLCLCGTAYAANTTVFNFDTGKLDYVTDTTALGNVTGTNATFTNLNCSTFNNGGAVTTNAAGVLICSNDDSGVGGSTNSFETWAVPAGSNPVADSATDTVTFTQTSPVVITGTASTDTINFAITQNAGTDITADLEEEGQISATTITGNAANSNLLVSTGTNTASWVALSNDATISTTGQLVIAAKAVNLKIDTTGPFVQRVNTVSPLVGGQSSDVEGAILTLSLTQNAGTDVTADLEEEGAINATAVTGNVTNTQLLVGTGASTAGWVTLGGDATNTNTGILTVAANAITGTKLYLAHQVKGSVPYYGGNDWRATPTGSTGQVLKMQATGIPTWDTDSTGVGGSPGGSDTQVQFNDATNFGGDSDLTWNKTTNVLTSTGTVSGAIVTATTTLTVGSTSSGTTLISNGSTYQPITLNNDATVSTTGQVVIAPKAINLKIDTTGPFVQRLNTVSPLVGGQSSDVEGAILNLSLTQNAGTDITADLEEEGQINATAVSNNAISPQLLIGTGSNTASWTTLGGDATVTNTGIMTVAANAVEGGNLYLAHQVRGSVPYYGVTWQTINPGTSGQFLQTKGAGADPVWATATASPAGSDTQVQFNDNGSLAGNANFTFNKTTNVLTLGSSTGTVSGSVVTATTTLRVPTTPPTDAAELAVSTSGDQLLYYSNAKRVLAYEQTRCAHVENLTATDDHMGMGSFVDGVTITKMWCVNYGSATTTTGIMALENGARTAMTHAAPTCSTPATIPNPVAVTAGGSLGASQAFAFNTTNTPAPTTDAYDVCVAYTINAK